MPNVGIALRLELQIIGARVEIDKSKLERQRPGTETQLIIRQVCGRIGDVALSDWL